tara:strand:+ start:18017 stop:18226 length:210 start_codon:yes stop_codon:yes gene_type:complete
MYGLDAYIRGEGIQYGEDEVTCDNEYCHMYDQSWTVKTVTEFGRTYLEDEDGLVLLCPECEKEGLSNFG